MKDIYDINPPSTLYVAVYTDVTC